MSRMFNVFKERIYNIASLGQQNNVRFLDNKGNVVVGIENADKFFISPLKNEKIDDDTQPKSGFILDFKDIGMDDQGVDIYLIGDANIKDFQKLSSEVSRECTKFNMIPPTTYHTEHEIKAKLGAFLNSKPQVTEGLEGSSMRSHQTFGDTKVIVKHNQPVGDYAGARTRFIESVFLENAQGERYKWPYNNVSGARAAARLMSEGFSYNGPKIRLVKQLSESFAHLKTVLGATRSAQLTENAGLIRTNIYEKAKFIKENLSRIANNRNFSHSLKECENLIASKMLIEDQDTLNSLRSTLQLDENFNASILGTVLSLGCHTINEEESTVENTNEWVEKLAHLDKITFGNASPKEIQNQANRMQDGKVRLGGVIKKHDTPPKFADSPDGKAQMVIWRLQEVSSRLGPNDGLLSNIISRYAEARSEKLLSKNVKVNTQDKGFAELIKWVVENLVKGPAKPVTMEERLEEWSNFYSVGNVLKRSQESKQMKIDEQVKLVNRAVGILSKKLTRDIGFKVVESWKANDRKAVHNTFRRLSPIGQNQVKHFISENWNFRINGVLIESLKNTINEGTMPMQGKCNAAVIDTTDPMKPVVKAFIFAMDPSLNDIKIDMPTAHEIFYMPLENEMDFEQAGFIEQEPWTPEPTSDLNLTMPEVQPESPHPMVDELPAEPATPDLSYGSMGDEMSDTDMGSDTFGEAIDEDEFDSNAFNDDLDQDTMHYDPNVGNDFGEDHFDDAELDDPIPADISTNQTKSWKQEISPPHEEHHSLSDFEDDIGSDEVLKNKFSKDPKGTFDVWSKN